MPYRCDCGTVLALDALLDALPAHGTGSSRMIKTRCPGCDTPMEIRLGNGRFEVGYSSFGGSVHFEAMKEVKLPGLHVVPGPPDDLDVTIGARHWHFSVPSTARQRFIVLDLAFAAGKRLGDLDFAQWGVDVEAVERNARRVEPASDVVIAGGDFLHLRGPEPALINAWRYVNDGGTRRGT